jgi:predicted outer membrane repeat protein
LQGATPPAQIWVASATYLPTTGTDRTATFQLRNGIAVLGGFTGTEIAAEERDPQANVTTLSGELGNPTSLNDNSCHVVTGSGVDSSAVLDGFSVTRGGASGCAANQGGGMFNATGSPTVRQVRFHGNGAVGGGGMYNIDGANALVEDVLFETNAAGSGGGGMANENSSPRVRNVVFRANTGVNGAGMLNWRGSHPTCTDCVFEGNTSGLPGGGVYNTQSAPLFVRTTFVGNSSPNGGGALYNEEVGGDMVCIDCVFRNNSTSIGTGGAAMIRLFAKPAFINTVFESNTADDFGGAIVSDTGSEILLVNVVFVGNRAETGGAATFHTGTRRLVNVTFAGNRSQTGGGALDIGSGATDVLNSVLWDNGRFDGQPGEILHTGGSLTIRHSLVSGGCAPPFVCEAVIDADPLFVRPPAWSGMTLTDVGDLRLRVGSPAIDAGLAAYLPADLWDLDEDGDTTEVLPIDILGQPRVQGLEVDLGAYEGGVVVGAEPAAPPSDLALNVAPNPTNGPVTVSLTLPAAAQHVRVTFHDVLGRVVETRDLASLPSGTTQLAWDAAGLRAGVYVVRAAGQSAVFTVSR